MGAWENLGKVFVKGAKYVLQHPGNAAKAAVYVPAGLMGGAAALSVGWNYFVKNKSLSEQAVDMALPESEKGASGGLNKLMFGSKNEDKSLVENVTDTAVGEGTYDKMVGAAKTAVDTAGKALDAAGRTAGDGVDSLRQRFSGASSPDATMAGMSEAELYEYYQQQALKQGRGQTPDQQNRGILSFLLDNSGIGNLLKGFSMGGTGMNLAALVSSAFLLFGNFGWMGKIGGLLLSGLAVKNMRRSQLVAPSQQPVLEPQLRMAEQPNRSFPYSGGRATEDLVFSEQEDRGLVVHRGRGV